MRISALSRRSGVPTATIKYYLREGLLHSGELTAATQAQYDESHLSRLLLIRALLGPGRLSIATIRDVLKVIDNPPESPNRLLGEASRALGASGASPGQAVSDLDQARALVEQLGWAVADNTAGLADLAQALAAIDQAELQLITGGVQRYGRLLAELADEEVATVPTESPESAVRQALLGTILIEPLLLALRRLALQDASVRRFGE